MEARKEIKRIFPNCYKCGNIFAQCDCAASRNAEEALEDFMNLRERLGELELREADCRCSDFYTCDLCREHSEKTDQWEELMDTWGENWALRLSKAEAKLLEFNQEWDGDNYVTQVPVNELLGPGPVTVPQKP